MKLKMTSHNTSLQTPHFDIHLINRHPLLITQSLYQQRQKMKLKMTPHNTSLQTPHFDIHLINRHPLLTTQRLSTDTGDIAQDDVTRNVTTDTSHVTTDTSTYGALFLGALGKGLGSLQGQTHSFQARHRHIRRLRVFCAHAHVLCTGSRAG